MKKLLCLLYLLLCLLLLSCGNSKQNRNSEVAEGKPVDLLYAKRFSIVHNTDYTTVTVYNPWQNNEVYDTYYLVKDEKVRVPENGHKIKIPLQSLMINSATHLGFMELLGELDKVKGVFSSAYIYNPTILKGVAEGKIKDLGDAFNLDIENLILLHPQAIMTSAYNADDENSKRMKQTGIAIIYNIEWQEKTLLGRAEWIKFMGAFFDKEQLADSIFHSVETRYNEIKAAAAKVQNKPGILSGQDYRGSWSMPTGLSYNAQLFRDAGGSYFYANDTTASGSRSSTIEEALVHFGQADVWVGADASSLEELGSIDKKYQLFKAFKNKQVYNINKRKNKNGGNDYWESGVARPDLLLSDMIRILHPELLPDYETVYMEKLK